MAAQNWMKSLPTTCFAIYGFSKAIPMVLEGSETMWFQRGFRRVWNRVVSTGFRGVWNHVVSEEFQRGLKPCGFRGVSEGSETVWFERGLKDSLFYKKAPKCLYDLFWIIWRLKIGWNRSRPLVLYMRLLQGHPEASSDGLRGVSEGSETFSSFKCLYDSFWIIWRLEIVKFRRWNLSSRAVLPHTACPIYGLPRCSEMGPKSFRKFSDGFREVSERFWRVPNRWFFSGSESFETVRGFREFKTKVILMFGRLGRGLRKLLLDLSPRGGLGLSSTNGGVFLVSNGFQA